MALAAHDPERTANPARLDWVDALRGFAILLVVVGHSWRGLFAAGLMPMQTFAGIDRAIYAFHMPLFFALAGFFFIPTLAHASGIWRVVFSRLQRLLYPLLLWTYIFIGAKLLAGPLANMPLQLGDLWVSPLPGRWHFWFLWALLLISLALLPLRPLLTDPARQTTTGFVLLGFSLAVQSLSLPAGLAHWIGPAVAMLPYFVLGLLFGPSLGSLPASGGLAALSVVVFAGLFVWTMLTAAPGLHPLLLAVLLGTAVVLSFAAARSLPGAADRLLRLMGTATMAIFLTHTFFSAALRETLLALGWYNLSSHMVLSVVVGILGPLWLLSLARQAGMERMLGF